MFSQEALAAILAAHPAPRRYRLAFSGGLDSHVLLHALAALGEGLGAPASAIHVDHGLHSESGAWAAHCARVAGELGVPLELRRVDGRPASGESPEAAARHARYAALAACLEAGDCLLTAHHQDDQAETLLLQLLRGAGPKGLAGMPSAAPFGPGLHRRPLLGFARAELRAYAEAHGLRWLEDPSNADTGLRRNLLRHTILPELRASWPAVARTLSRSAGHCAEAAALMEELAAADLDAAGAEDAPGGLALAALRRLSPARRHNLLRHWLERQGLPLPHLAHLARVDADLLGVREDAAPVVAWPGAELHRYRGALFALPPLPALPEGLRLTWDGEGVLELPDGLGRLEWARADGAGLAPARLAGARLEVAFRGGGERLRPAGRAHHHPLKKLFQEWGVPPWLRPRLPLLYVDGQLAAVAGLAVADEFRAVAGAVGALPRWRVPSALRRGPHSGTF